MKAIVLGSGAWGTALSLLLLRNGHQVTLWSHDPDKAAQLRQTRENPRLTGVMLPEELEITGDLAAAEAASFCVFAAPSYAVRDIAFRAAPHLQSGALLVSVAKGVERDTHLRMSQLLLAAAGEDHPVAVLSGPSHAEEVARRMPTGCIAAARDRETALAVQSAFMNQDFRVYTNPDVVGVELCGAVKNVVALGCGIADGLGFGDNAKALLITRAMSEAASLCIQSGGLRETCAGLAGIGDLIVTCTSRHSRNRRAGVLIGQGTPVNKALRDVNAVVEGYYAAESIRELAETLGVSMPICHSIYGVLYQSLAPAEAMRSLMDRDPRSEFTGLRWENDAD